MKSRLVIVMAMVCLTAGIWALPACGDESPADQQKSYYLKCINDEIENNSCKVVLTASRSKKLQAYGEKAALRTVFLSQNRDALAQEMVAQKVSMRPQAVQQYLQQRFNQETHVQMALNA
jgi:hypothetical protein